MHVFSYNDILEDSAVETRRREREAFDRVIGMLAAAEPRGPDSREGIEALYHLRQLWTLLMEDLAADQNELPEKLRASLLSIGIFMLKEAEELRIGAKASFETLIAINTIIRDGLK